MDKDTILINLEAELCKRSFYDFFVEATKVIYGSIDWKYGWYYKYLCDIFQLEVERIIRQEEKDKDYIINIPFRTGKSTLISVMLPVWWWIKDPSAQILTVSATDALAVKFSHQSKILIESDWFVKRFGNIFSLRQDQHAKGNYMTDKGGLRQAFGINSTIIGSGGNIICDDLNSPDNVSETGLRNVTNSYLDVLYTRLNNPSVDIRIILAQRVHELDISGFLIKNHKERYNHICLPATQTVKVNPPELVEYYKDGLLHPERFSAKIIDNFKQTMRATAFSGQLLQSPTPAEGTLIKRNWFGKVKWSEIMDYPIKWDLVIDTAYTEKKENDPSAFNLCGAWNNKLYIRRVSVFWKEFHDLITQIKEWKKTYNVNRIFIEGKASGKSIIQELKRQTSYSVIEIEPDSDKVSRVNAIQPQLQAGEVILVEDEWNDAFLAECAAFPLGANDDRVDTLVYSVDEVHKKTGKITTRVR